MITFQAGVAAVMRSVVIQVPNRVSELAAGHGVDIDVVDLRFGFLRVGLQSQIALAFQPVFQIG